ncbi:MAG: hypothetical protein AAF843_04980 [Bacteroidota bacterium]
MRLLILLSILLYLNIASSQKTTYPLKSKPDDRRYDVFIDMPGKQQVRKGLISER